MNDKLISVEIKNDYTEEDFKKLVIKIAKINNIFLNEYLYGVPDKIYISGENALILLQFRDNRLCKRNPTNKINGYITTLFSIPFYMSYLEQDSEVILFKNIEIMYNEDKSDIYQVPNGEVIVTYIL